MAHGVVAVKIVDDNKPNVPPEYVILKIKFETGIMPAYNITGRVSFILMNNSGLNVMLSERGEVFPVYRKADVEAVVAVLHPGSTSPALIGIQGGTFARNRDTGYYHMVVDDGGKAVVYRWKP